MNVLKEQYDWVMHTRKLLFHFCEKVNQEDYTKEMDTFGGNSMRSLHQHVAECYHYWLGKVGLKDPDFFERPEQVNDVNEMRKLFDEVDQLVYRFLDHFEGQEEKKISRGVQDEEEEFSVLWLYTHTSTHEFHHKGQIVWLARQLGYEPPDTDLITASDINRYSAYPEQI
ncbi:DinB family protein [Bacillus sp. NTK071]|uniref:DinB family protein n=1 Tax=Bacillus sp. NTK071 TaxID=2802175 RepID=UPI001A8E2771|nr:DinB family protein [Bacillus sp. NTK071]MBN8209035.1 DinB family protein [Bacillus sp. NTK071]